MSADQSSTGRFGSDMCPTAAEIEAELERILAARCFVNAGRASQLLQYLVRETLDGRGARLKGYSVAVEVFGRKADFDAHADPLVRVEAGRLRRRLIEYYADEGRADPVIIDVPRGGYAVKFRYARRDPGDAAAPASDVNPPATVEIDRGGWLLDRHAYRRMGALAAAVSVVVALLAVSVFFATRRVELPPSSAASGESPPSVLAIAFDASPSGGDADEFAPAILAAIVQRLRDVDGYVVADAGNWFQPLSPPGSNESAARQYFVTGNIRADDSGLEVRLRLIASETGERLWSESFDIEPASATPSAVAENIAARVASVALPYGPIFDAELARLGRVSAQPHVYECFLRYYAYRRAMDPALHGDAISCFQSATESAQSSADAWAGLALLSLDEYRFGYNARAESPALDRVRTALSRALAVDADNYLANLAVARLHYFVQDDEEFRHSAERVLAMRPDAADALALLGLFFVVSGDTAKGLPLVDRAIELTPKPPGIYRFAHVAASLREGRLHEALSAAEKLETPNWPLGQIYLAAIAGLAGRGEIASAARQRLLERDPLLAANVAGAVERLQLDATLRAKLLGGLNAAGFDALASSSAD
jgi:adenylate cyclase